MENLFEKFVVKKIARSVQNHIEPYQEGAWENFLARKKNKKKKMIFRYVSGIAASVLFIFIIGVFFFHKGKESIQNKETLLGRKNDSDTVNSKSNLPRSILDSSLAMVDTPFIESPSAKKLPLISKNDISEERASQASYLDEQQGRNSSGVNANIDSTMTLEGIPIVKAVLEKTTDSLHAIPVDEHNQDEKAVGRNRSKPIMRILLSPGFGTTQANSQSLNSSFFGGGASIELPVSSQFAVGSGLVLNSFDITNEAVVIKNSSSQMDRIEISQINVDIPLTIRYSIPNRKNNLYVIAGVSSYYCLSQNADITSSMTREIQVIRLEGGMEQVTTVTETVTDKNSLPQNNNRFSPAAMINFSFGIRAYSSENMSYEIQPFYKHPVKPLSDHASKFPMGGVTLTVTFTRRK
jgi:hypothetical protein